MHAAIWRQVVDDHTVSPAIDGRFPFEGTADAIARVGSGHSRGKVVIVVA